MAIDAKRITYVREDYNGCTIFLDDTTNISVRDAFQEVMERLEPIQTPQQQRIAAKRKRT